MATAPTVPDFSQYNFVIGDTTEVVTKQNGMNAALAEFGDSLTAMTDSIDQDLVTMDGLKTDTQAAAQAADEDAQQTALDRVATGEDATQTAADRLQTGEDRTATAADRVATDEDTVATAADRVATGEDRTAAADSAASAADSAANASGTWDTIRGAYYGALADDPTADPLGNPPAAGDRYFNTAENVEKSYNGSAWVYNEIGTHEAAPDPHAQYEFRVQHNTSAGAPPTADDDSSAGYAPRSLWFDTSVTPPEAYRCIDATAGAAVWVKTTLTLDELGSAASEDAADLRDRSTHTGTQTLSTISDAGTAALQDDGRYAHRTNNLADLGSPATARDNLGLGTAATFNDGRYLRQDVSGSIAGGLTVETSYRVMSSGNRHVWFESNDGAEQALIWHDATNGRLRMRLKNGGAATLAELTIDSNGDVSPSGGQFAGPAGGLTGLDTGAVNAAISGSGLGQVGTYALLENDTGVQKSHGDTAAGSNLIYGNNVASSTTRPAGTWRVMGHSPAGTISLWVRIS